MCVLLPKKSALRHRGFTLIELIVTVAIMALLVGGAIAGFITFRERQAVQTAAKDLQQLLRTAQAKARVRDTPSSCNSSILRLQGYRVTINTTTAYIRPLCAAENTTPGDPGAFGVININEDVLTLSSGINIEVSNSDFFIDFYTLHRGMYIGTLWQSFTDTVIKIDGDVADWCFTVHTSGAITEPIDCTPP